MNNLVRAPADARMIPAVNVNGLPFLEGVTPRNGACVEQPRKNVLPPVYEALEAAGTSRSRLVAVKLWLRDIMPMPGLNCPHNKWAGRPVYAGLWTGRTGSTSSLSRNRINCGRLRADVLAEATRS